LCTWSLKNDRKKKQNHSYHSNNNTFILFLTTHLHAAGILEVGGSHDFGGTCCRCLSFRPVASSICCSQCGQNATTDNLPPATASLQKKTTSSMDPFSLSLRSVIGTTVGDGPSSSERVFFLCFSNHRNGRTDFGPRKR
jgi:hypothetical protein